MAYIRMDDGTAEEYALDLLPLPGRRKLLPAYALGQLELLKGELGGAAIDRYDHSLQTATRVLRDGGEPDAVVAALLHDIGDTLAPDNHAELAAAVLRPYVSEEQWWVVRHHDIFQGYYWFHHLGYDRELRDSYRGSPHYAATVRFCHLYDQVSFDPAYDNEPLDTFLPRVRDVFAREPRDVMVGR
jgi:predicted HD phosphohydrolase